MQSSRYRRRCAIARYLRAARKPSRCPPGYGDWPGFYAYHEVGYQETEDCDYEAYKAIGFRPADETVPPLGPPPQGLAF